MKQVMHTGLAQQLKIALTPQLQQAIGLLQLSNQELAEQVQEILDKNPLLEAIEDGVELSAQEIAQSEEKTGQQEALTPTPTAEEPTALTTNDSEDSWRDVAPTTMNRDDGQLLNFELTDTSDTSLRHYLLWQMRLTPFSDTDIAIATAIIDSINEEGYLDTPLEEIAELINGEEETVTLDEIEAVLHRIQHFDPIGVAARSLQEFLQLQVQILPQETPGLALAKTILQQHFELLAQRDHKQLRKVCQADDAQLTAAMQLIQSLNPRPAHGLFETPPEITIPDVMVSKQNGKWVVELNNTCTPKIQINDSYAQLAKDPKARANVAQLKEQLQEARWFLKSLESRNETLLKVALCIVEHQQAFLEQGDVAMKPLILQDVAEATELHESTVSRITTKKYIQTPVGLYELKYFFSSHLQTQGGQECSSTAIRAFIKQLIHAEDKAKPLSDNKLAQLLNEQQGICIARRTITKYREAMGIPSSSDRKRFFQPA